MGNRSELDSAFLIQQTAGLRALAASLVGDGARADDLVQDTVLQALEDPAAPRSGSWLRGVLRNRWRMEARAARRRRAREHLVARSESGGTGAEPESLEVLEILVAEVRALAEPYRRCVAARYFEGCSPQEIAAESSVPVATVYTRIKRGLETLRGRMEARLGGGDAWRGRLALAAGLELGRRSVLWSLAGVLVVGAALALGARAVWFAPDSSAVEGGDTAVLNQSEPVVQHEADEAPLPDSPGTAVPDPTPQRTAAEPEPPAAALFGRILDPQGQPLVGAELRLGRNTVQTDRDGRYQVAYVGGSGSRRLRIRAEGYATLYRELEGIEPPERRDYELVAELQIEGRVTDRLGRPLVGVELGLHASSMMLSRRAESDAEGRYRFRALDPAHESFTLNARKSGYQYHQVKVSDSGRHWERDITLLERAEWSLEGRVLDPEGQPLVGSPLFLGTDPADADRMDAETGADGRFEFAAVPAGVHWLNVRDRRFAPEIVVVEVGERGAIGGPFEIRLQPGREIRGRVVDPGGRAIHGARVSAWMRGSSLDRRVEADEEGRFTLSGMPLEGLSLRATARGYFVPKNPDSRVGLRTISIPDGEGEPLLTMQPAGGLRGTVVDAETGHSISEFTIRFVHGGPYPGTWFSGHSFSDPDGRWTTGDLDMDTGDPVGVEVSAEGYGLQRFEALPRVAGAEEGEHQTRLQPAKTLHGYVVDGLGSPIAGAKVIVQERTQETWPHLAWRAGATVLSGPDGRFELTYASDREILLQVRHSAYAPQVLGPRPVASLGTEAVQVTLGEGASVQGVLLDGEGKPRAGVRVGLSGMLASEGGPMSSSGPDRFMATDSAGSIRFDRLGAGRYELKEYGLGGSAESYTELLRLGIEDALVQEFVFRPPTDAAALRIRARIDGQPARGKLYVTLSGAWRRRHVATGDTVLVESLPPGKYRVHCRCVVFGTGAWEADTEIELMANGSQEVVLDLREDLETR